MEFKLISKSTSKLDIVIGIIFCMFTLILTYITVIAIKQGSWFYCCFFLVCCIGSSVNSIILIGNGTQRTVSIENKCISVEEYRIINFRIKKTTVIELSWQEVEKILVYKNIMMNNMNNSIKVVFRRRTCYGSFYTIGISGANENSFEIIKIFELQLPNKLEYVI